MPTLRRRGGCGTSCTLCGAVRRGDWGPGVPVSGVGAGGVGCRVEVRDPARLAAPVGRGDDAAAPDAVGSPADPSLEGAEVVVLVPDVDLGARARVLRGRAVPE